MGAILSYYRKIVIDNVTYSVDKLVVDVKCSFLFGGINTVLKWLSDNIMLKLEHWTTDKIGGYASNFSISVNNDDSYFVGVGLNEASGVTQNIRLEFNPNKVAECFDFVVVWNKVLSTCEKLRIVRFDLAVDYPVLREDTYLIKDNRKYSEYRTSYKNRTQYLGNRSTNGYCKLYNKTTESKLNQPVTRFEMTIDYKSFLDKSYREKLPKVLHIKDIQYCFDLQKLAGTDRFIIECLLNGCVDDITFLGRYKRQKIQELMTDYLEELTVSEKCHKHILETLEVFTNYIEVVK